VECNSAKYVDKTRWKKTRIEKGLKPTYVFIILLWMLLLPGPRPIFAVDRFPRPGFETDYPLPEITAPEPRSGFYAYLDVGLLIACLVLATYLALKRRTRAGIFLLMLFSLFYFGFWRKGCVCPVGSIQNIVLVFFDPSYRIPLTVVAFFVLPLIFTLFFGRTFCAAVCPLGAIQDVFILQPVRVPLWIAQPLGLLPYIFLGLAVLSVATGSGFLICRFDPFVGIFHVSGHFGMLIFGAGLLILGIFVARPYCRFLCPYGVLLKWVSRFSKWHVRISPDECIECRLCEDSCPFGAILKPAPDRVPENNLTGIRRLLILLLLLPVLILGSGFLGSRLNLSLSRLNRTVLLADQVMIEDRGLVGETTLDSRIFRETGKPKAELFQQALSIREQFRGGGFIFGGFLGLVFSIKLIELSIRRKRKTCEPDRASCISCGRCFKCCPKEQARRRELRNTQKEGILPYF